MKLDRLSWLRAIGSAVVLACGVGCGAESDGDDDAITIGLLLPFTGSDSATASNFERAVLFARDQVNDAGGVHGRRLRIVSADTHSDVARAARSTQTLIEAGAVVVIGPESAEIAREIKPMLDEREIVFLSPLIGAADDRAVDCATPWFRLAPSARALGEALAKNVIAEGLRKGALLSSDGEYDVALSQAFERRFLALGGQVVFSDTLERRAQSYDSSIRGALQAGADSILLSTSARSGALAVNGLGALGASRPRWFLSPLLKTEVLLQNVIPQALEGALGVTPRIYDTSADFPRAFAERWQGDQPLEGAYFYYDALALIALGLEKAPLEAGAWRADELRAAVVAVAGPPGEAGRWNELSSSLATLRDSGNAYYTGLTGPMLLRPCGDRQAGASSTWVVRQGRIEVSEDP